MGMKNSTNAVKVTIWMPEILSKALDERIAMMSVREKCSKSWAVCEILMGELGITDEQVNEARGYAIPKAFVERAENPEWTPRKKKTLEKAQ